METLKKIFLNGSRALLHHRKSDRIVPLVLASSSPTKQKILELLGIGFTSDPAAIDETKIVAETSERLVEKIARMKGLVVKERHPQSVVVAADTLIFHEGKPIGKPIDEEGACEILKLLSGSAHLAMTGLAVWDPLTERMVTHVEVSTVQFRLLTHAMITAYVQTGEPMGRAGAYALQGKGGELVESLKGERTNVYGLPVKALINLLSSLDYDFVPD